MNNTGEETVGLSGEAARPLPRRCCSRSAGRRRKRRGYDGTVVGGFAPFGLPLTVGPGGAVKLPLPARFTHGRFGLLSSPDLNGNIPAAPRQIASERLCAPGLSFLESSLPSPANLPERLLRAPAALCVQSPPSCAGYFAGNRRAANKLSRNQCSRRCRSNFVKQKKINICLHIRK